MIIILVQSVNFLTNYDTTQQLCVVIISEKKSSKKLMASIHIFIFSEKKQKLTLHLYA
jgi:hypothetical protein